MSSHPAGTRKFAQATRLPIHSAPPMASAPSAGRAFRSTESRRRGRFPVKPGSMPADADRLRPRRKEMARRRLRGDHPPAAAMSGGANRFLVPAVSQRGDSPSPRPAIAGVRTPRASWSDRFHSAISPWIARLTSRVVSATSSPAMAQVVGERPDPRGGAREGLRDDSVTMPTLLVGRPHRDAASGRLGGQMSARASACARRLAVGRRDVALLWAASGFRS